MMYSETAAFQHHLRFFSIGDIEVIEGAKGKYEDSILAFIPNSFGIMTAAFLLMEALEYWNRKNTGYLSTLKDKAAIKGSREPFDVFKNLIPGNEVNKTVIKTEEGDPKRTYCFKVSLTKDLWRKIKMPGTNTLGDLHYAIQKAFDFDNDHLYAFYLGGSRKTGNPVYCEEAHDEGVFAEEVTVAEIGLFAGQKLVYLFDFGDMWEFSVKLISIEKEMPLLKRPVIVEKKGSSPKQYQEFW